MKGNVGVADRLIRVALGIFLLFQGFINGHLWGYLGVVPLFTGAIGWCPIFELLGISTVCKACSCTGGTDCEPGGGH